MACKGVNVTLHRTFFILCSILIAGLCVDSVVFKRNVEASYSH